MMMFQQTQLQPGATTKSSGTSQSTNASTNANVPFSCTTVQGKRRGNCKGKKMGKTQKYTLKKILLSKAAIAMQVASVVPKVHFL